MTQYYVNFNDIDGGIAGFYVDDIHGDNIPQTAVPITVSEWQTYSSDASRYKRDGDSIREKMQSEIDVEIAARPPVPLSPAEQRIADLEIAIATLVAGGGV